MISDAANSAGDIFSSFMSTIGSKIASIPNDETHNFGHGKAEYIFSLFISLSMIIVSAKLIYDSIISLFNPSSVEYPFWLILVCIITIITKLTLFIYTKIIGKKTYGKGVVQNVMALPEGDGLKLTTSEYFTPSGKSINKKGIEPDIEVDLPEDIKGIGIDYKDTDTQLQKAIEIINEK